jgi:hypothetical protein
MLSSSHPLCTVDYSKDPVGESEGESEARPRGPPRDGGDRGYLFHGSGFFYGIYPSAASPEIQVWSQKCCQSCKDLMYFSRLEISS